MNKLIGDYVHVVLNISETRGFGKIKKPSVTAKFNNQEIKTDLKITSIHAKDSAKTELVWRTEKTVAKKARGEYDHIRLDIFTIERHFFGYTMICLRTAKILCNSGGVTYRWIRLNSVPAAFKQGNPEIYIALSIRECKDQEVAQGVPVNTPTEIHIAPALSAVGSSQPIETPESIKPAEASAEVVIELTLKTKDKAADNNMEDNPSDAVPKPVPFTSSCAENVEKNPGTDSMLEDESASSLLEALSTALNKANLREIARCAKPAVPLPSINLYIQTTVHFRMHSLFWLDDISIKNIHIVYCHPTAKTQKRYKASTQVEPGATYIPFDNVECTITYVMLPCDKVSMLDRYPLSMEVYSADTKKKLTSKLFMTEETVINTDNNMFVFKRRDGSRLCSSIIYIDIYRGNDIMTMERRPEAELMPIVISDSCVRHNLRQFEEWVMDGPLQPQPTHQRLERSTIKGYTKVEECKPVDTVPKENEEKPGPSSNDQ